MNGKKIAIGVGLLVWLVGGYFLASYLAGGAYFLVSKTMPHGITPDTWWTYWHWYSTDVLQRKHLQVAAAIGVFITYGVPLLIASYLSQTTRSLYGDARFANASEVRAKGFNAEDGIIIGKFQGQYLIFSGQQFVLVAAPTRGGKGVAVVIPNLLNYGQSLVCLDIKLENFNYTSGFRAANGQKVFLFAPFAEDGKTHRWNPLDGISKSPYLRVGDIQTMAESFWPSDASSKDSFFNDSARNVFLGIVLYLKETPSLPCTMGEVLRQSSGKGMPIKDYIMSILVARSNGDDALSDECLDALNRLVNTSDNTLTSIVATFNAPLTIFASPIVDAATSATDFDVAMVRKEPMSIYVGIQPDRLATAKGLLNLFFSQLINLNTKELPQNNPALKYQCLLLLDEFTAIGKISILASANSFIAGYNLRLLPIIQSVSQLESVYGKEDTRTFVANHAVQIIFPPREQKDANEVSESLGYLTAKGVSTGISTPRAFGQNGSSSENVSDQKRALMLPQELREMPVTQQIIIAENVKPILSDKARYFADHVFMDRLKSISPTLAALGRKLPSQKELEHAALVLGELRSQVPTVDFALHKAMAERRMREVKLGEEIDLAKLALNIEGLPPAGEPATREEAAAICDAFFGSMEWCNTDTGEVTKGVEVAELVDLGEPIAQAPPASNESAAAAAGLHGDAAGGGFIESGVEFAQGFEPSFDAPPDDAYLEDDAPAFGRTIPTKQRVTSDQKIGNIDLSVLDR